MYIPDYVMQCITRLEEAGFSCYAVGGCVRDACLGLTPHDYDLCTAATPEVLKQLFSDRSLITAGEKHGTVGVITEEGVVEITTFRTEGSYEDHRHPQWVEFVSDIEADLARRDFTVNAMAFSPTRGLMDPFGGRQDLNSRVLRAVGDPVRRFREDALRILRGLRFSVRFGLTPDKSTMQAMTALSPLMDSLAKERVFEELCKLLPLVTAEDLLRFGPILGSVLPALKATIGFDQHSPHHVFDVFTHTAYVTAAVPQELTLRWAALLHDIGKVPTFAPDATGRGHFHGHAKVSAQMADEILRQLKAPSSLREQVVLLIEKHMMPLSPDKRLLRRRLSHLGKSTVHQLIALQRADFCSKGVLGDDPQFDRAEALIEEILAENSCLHISDLEVDGFALMDAGFSGRQIGQCLSYLLEQVLDEAIPNKKAALLEAADAYRRTSP